MNFSIRAPTAKAVGSSGEGTPTTKTVDASNIGAPTAKAVGFELVTI